MELRNAANFISFLTIITFFWIAENVNASREYNLNILNISKVK